MIINRVIFYQETLGLIRAADYMDTKQDAMKQPTVQLGLVNSDGQELKLEAQSFSAEIEKERLVWSVKIEFYNGTLLLNNITLEMR